MFNKVVSLFIFSFILTLRTSQASIPSNTPSHSQQFINDFYSCTLLTQLHGNAFRSQQLAADYLYGKGTFYCQNQSQNNLMTKINVEVYITAPLQAGFHERHIIPIRIMNFRIKNLTDLLGTYFTGKIYAEYLLKNYLQMTLQVQALDSEQVLNLTLNTPLPLVSKIKNTLENSLIEIKLQSVNYPLTNFFDKTKTDSSERGF